MGCELNGLRVSTIQVDSFAAAISAIGLPLVSVRAIIARRSSSVCRGFLIFESPSVFKTQRYEAHASGASRVVKKPLFRRFKGLPTDSGAGNRYRSISLPGSSLSTGRVRFKS